MFAGKWSVIVSPKNIQPLDLILVKESGHYSHILLIVGEDEKLCAAQSNLSGEYDAINSPIVFVEDNYLMVDYKPIFAKDWKHYSEKNIIEVRRLKCFD